MNMIGNIIFRGTLAACAMTGLLHAQQMWTSGHGDIGIGFHDDGEGPEFELHYHLEGGIVNGVPQDDVEFEPDELTVRLPSTSRFFRSESSAFDPIGVGALEPYFRVPQSGTLADSLGIPYVGLATEEIDAGIFQGESVNLRLTGVLHNGGAGSGVFSLWQVPDINPVFYMSNANGIGAEDLLTLSTGGHDHFNYGFSEIGIYEVTLEASGILASDGTTMLTDEAVYVFNVVPEPTTVGSIFAVVALACAFVARQRRKS